MLLRAIDVLFLHTILICWTVTFRVFSFSVDFGNLYKTLQAKLFFQPKGKYHSTTCKYFSCLSMWMAVFIRRSLVSMEAVEKDDVTSRKALQNFHMVVKAASNFALSAFDVSPRLFRPRHLNARVNWTSHKLKSWTKPRFWTVLVRECSVTNLQATTYA